MSAEHLTRLRSAVVGVLALTVALSLIANVLSAEPSLIGRAVAAWPPIALLICTDLISRVPTSRRALGLGRQAAAVVIAGIAAALSYGHMVTLASHHGATPRAAHVVPLTVDGLAIVASLCLLEIGARLRQLDTAPAAAPAEPAPAAGVGSVGARAPSDRTDRTDKTLKPQVRVGEFRQTGHQGASDRTDKTLPPARRGPLAPAGDDLPARVRALAVEHPEWTQAAIAQKAECSVRTVRRHLTGSTSSTDPSTHPAPLTGADDTQEVAA